jgi:hypothetical protein
MFCDCVRVLHRADFLVRPSAMVRYSATLKAAVAISRRVFMRLSVIFDIGLGGSLLLLPVARFEPRAQYLRHPPVDELHSMENKADRGAIVCLTLSLAAVKHTRSLTVSKVFPVGGESGAQASSLRPSAEWKSSANPATAVAGDQGRRSRDVRAKALASPFRHGGAGGNQAWRQRRRQGQESATLRVLDDREIIGPRTGRNPVHGRSGRTDLPDGLPAANWQAC